MSPQPLAALQVRVYLPSVTSAMLLEFHEHTFRKNNNSKNILSLKFISDGLETISDGLQPSNGLQPMASNLIAMGSTMNCPSSYIILILTGAATIFHHLSRDLLPGDFNSI